MIIRCFILFGFSIRTDAWVTPLTSCKMMREASFAKTHILKSSTLVTESDSMKEVLTFESWFQTIPGSNLLSDISHADFGNLRGLTMSPAKKSMDSPINLMNVPKSIVLSSDFTQSDWDVDLAEQLWMECKRGPSSSLSGYVALLTNGWSSASTTTTKDRMIPPSTAPDTLRHWSNEEKQRLKGNEAGDKLLNLLEQQNQLWRDKFTRRQMTDNEMMMMTYEQFEWAMETVHSRAFCGKFGIIKDNDDKTKSPILSSSSIFSFSAISGIVIPLVAAISGFQYYYQNPNANDLVMMGFAFMALTPTIFFNLVMNQSPPFAVLLPMIDSANHRDDAPSNIEYDPLSNSFTLSITRDCLVKENDGKTQVYVSYGSKKDTELLLNYGFLPGVDSEGNTQERRKALAETFLSRQSRRSTN